MAELVENSNILWLLARVEHPVGGLPAVVAAVVGAALLFAGEPAVAADKDSKEQVDCNSAF